MSTSRRVLHESSPRDRRRSKPFAWSSVVPAIATVLFVSLFASQSAAGPLEDAVDRIESKVIKIKNNTDGLQDLVGNVKGVTRDFRADAFDDLKSVLMDAQDLIALLKARREEAGSPADHPDLAVLVGAVSEIVGILLGDSSADFGVLTKVIEILPDPVVAVAGMAVSRSGVDADSVAEMQQVAASLAAVRDALLVFDADQESVFASRNAQSAVLGTLVTPTRCREFNEYRVAVDQGARVMRRWALRFFLIGEALHAKEDLFVDTKRVGIHGYVGWSFNANLGSLVGGLLRGASAALLGVAESAFVRLDHCEHLRYMRQTLMDQERVLAKLESGNVCNRRCIATEDLEVTCDDGIDNDCNGMVDSADAECQFAACNNDGICDAGEGCMGCANDCAGITSGKYADRYCCGNGTVSAPEGDGAICDGNY